MDTNTSAAELRDPADTYRGVLHALIDIGTEMARVAGRDAAGGDLAAASVVFDRVARSVRRCIALARTLDAPVVMRETQAAARRQVIRAVEDCIEAECDEAEGESLRAELRERLEMPELAEEIGDRPIEAVVADICRDLGLSALPGTRPWKRRTPEDVAVLHRLAAGPLERAGEGAGVLLWPPRLRGK